MSDTSFSEKLHNLSKQYYQSHIGHEEYRALRKVILDEIDKEFNGHKQQETQMSRAESTPDFMSTVVYFNDTNKKNGS